MNGANTLIRHAKAADVEAVRKLLVETWHDTYDSLIGAAKVTEITNSWHSIENLSRQLTMPDTSFLVAEENGAIVGHILVTVQKTPFMMISRLYVRPDRQRRGIGSTLIDASAARHQNCDTFGLEVEADNKKGLSFYLREGFREVGRSVTQGIDHIRMEKRLVKRS